MGKGGKNAIFYVTMLIVFGLLIYLVAIGGEALQIDSAVAAATHAPRSLAEGFDVFVELLMHHVQSDIGILLLQIIVILITCRVFGWLFSRMGQPTVVGEIIAGIVLGPSVLGNILPSVSFLP